MSPVVQERKLERCRRGGGWGDPKHTKGLIYHCCFEGGEGEPQDKERGWPLGIGNGTWQTAGRKTWIQSYNPWTAVLPTTWMGLEADSSPNLPERNTASLIWDFGDSAQRSSWATLCLDFWFIESWHSK